MCKCDKCVWIMYGIELVCVYECLMYNCIYIDLRNWSFLYKWVDVYAQIYKCVSMYMYLCILTIKDCIFNIYVYGCM